VDQDVAFGRSQRHAIGCGSFFGVHLDLERWYATLSW
jgi:hypothetical protein